MGETMRGIDISNWQGGLNILNLAHQIDFAIMKATEGNNFVDSFCDGWVTQCKKAKLCWAFYHFARNNNPEIEAEFFIQHTKGYFGKGIPVLDIEDDSISDWGEWATRFCKRVHDKTGVWPIVYCSASRLPRFKGTIIPKKCGLWVAGYPYTMTNWTNDACPYGAYPWDTIAIWQFTSSLQLYGYDGRLDGNIAYINNEQWAKYATGDNKPSPTPTPKPKPKKKTLDDVVFEVILGEYGTGKNRKKALEKEGWNYKKVQNRVNEYYSCAHKVLHGEYGNGQQRINQLKNGGYIPECVQHIVNDLLS